MSKQKDYPNLKPNDALQDPKTAAELGRKGGIASGKARRRKADLRKTMNMVLNMDMPEGQVKQQLEDAGIDPNLGAGLALSVVFQALKRGDANALKIIAQLAGQDTTLLDRQEQRARVEKIKAETARLNEELGTDDDKHEDDGFIEALRGKAGEVWQQEQEEQSES